MTSISLKHTILGIVETQLRTGDPQDTRRTLERLQAAGVPRARAVEMIGAVVAEEIGHVLRDQQEFNQPRFAAALAHLHAPGAHKATPSEPPAQDTGE